MTMFLQSAFRLKIVSVVLGLINVLLTTQFYKPESIFEVFLLSSLAVTFVISVIYLSAVHYLGNAYSQSVRKCDAAIHFVMGLLTFSVSVIFLFMIEISGNGICKSAFKTDTSDCLTTQVCRIGLGVLCIINSVLYGVICHLLLSNENKYEMI